MGHQVTVFEAEKELGGLVAGFDLDGVPLEKAYHFLYKTDSHIINLANEIGIGDTLTFHSSSVAIAYGGKIYPFMTPLDLLKFTPLSFFNRIRAGARNHLPFEADALEEVCIRLGSRLDVALRRYTSNQKSFGSQCSVVSFSTTTTPSQCPMCGLVYTCE